MILALAIYLTALAVAVELTLIGWSIRTSIRRHRRAERIRAERYLRAPEDICWRYCRDDAYQQALFIALRRRVRGDQRLLRDLGIQVDDRWRLEVVR